MSAYWADPARNMPAESNINSLAHSDPQSGQATTMTPGQTISVLTIRSIDKHQANIALPSCEMCGQQLVRDEQHDYNDDTLFGRTLCVSCMLYRRQIWCEGFGPGNESLEDEEHCDEGYHNAPEEVADY